MNIQLLKNIIQEYKKQISTMSDIEAIDERNEKMRYYQSGTKERIKRN
jgi:hypothetical protein